MDFKENNIEWITGEKVISLTLTSQRHITKIKKLAEKKPEDVKIIVNKDGSVYAEIPLTYLKLRAPKDLTDEQRQKIADRFKHNTKKSI